uniref:Zinc finger, CCHC-type n=1 Tax=Tanacetum cinerariifolium TaxID=118510 RepID=A0A699HZL8_TANCI|nr:zinc finger, CCHC-type [Tanacetum cinerariifolium]
MVRPETAELLILYWTTYIECDFQTIYPRHKMGLNMLLDIVIPDYDALFEGKLAHLEQPLIPSPYPIASQATCDAYEALHDAQNEVACLMLGSISPELQRALENYKAYDMIQELKTMSEEQAKQELFETVKVFHACKQEDGQSISSYLLKMKSYLDTLERLGFAMPIKLGVSLILNSLNKDYNMHNIRKTIAELHAMLKLYEKGISKKAKTPSVLAIQEDNVFYFNAIPRDGIYEIDMNNLYPNVSYMFNVGNKRAKHALDSSYLWHCLLGHINMKRMDKLQRDGILQPTHDESLEK